MPNYENNNKVGDLYVTFDIDFPKKDLTEEEKKSKKFVILFIYISNIYLIFKILSYQENFRTRIQI